MPALKGTEMSLSCVQCFLCLVSSENVSIFHLTCMNEYLLDRVYMYIVLYILVYIYTYTHIYNKANSNIVKECGDRGT